MPPSIIDTITTGPPSPSTSNSCFLSCFGCSGEKTQLKDEVNSVSRRRRRRWISNWSFSFKKSPTKTVPVDLTTDAPPEENATPTKKHTMIVDGNHDPVISSEQKPRRKKWTTAVKGQNAMSHHSRQKETKPAATSAFGPDRASQEQKTVTIARPFVSFPLKPLTLSKPLPPTKRQKPPHAPPTSTGGVDGGVFRKTPQSRGEFDSIIVMSTTMVILIILVLWGKLCAILCTSAWLFIVPRLVAARKYSGVDEADEQPLEARNKLDLESEEYKKKVILEGFLQRNNRKLSVGRL